MSPAQLLDGLLHGNAAGQRRAMAKAITLLESTRTDHRTLAEMTRAAITRLRNNPKGYVLLVEGGRIDHAHHKGNAHRALVDTIALSDAVKVADTMTSAEDTLILVTADHAHTLGFVGYPVRGNPVLGKVRAGLPQMEDQTAGQEMVGVEDYLIRHPERTVFCRVRGDSMRDAGLIDGDMVVVERNRPTKSGDIVVALVDNEMTVKYLFPLAGPGGWVLKPAHPDYPDILARESLEVIGVVVGMFRQVGR